MFGRLIEMLSGKPEEQPDTGELVPLAVCVLLLEAAGADEEFAPVERAHILDILRERFSLSPEEAEQLMALASERRAESVDLWKFTNTLNEQCDNEEKIAVVREVWRVVLADGVLDGHEDYLVHKMGKLLNLTHPQLIGAKLDAKEGR